MANGHGGKRRGAGRKSKDTEKKIVDQLRSNIGDETAINALKKMIAKGSFQAVQLYFNYVAGKPKESVEIDQNVRQSIDFKQLFKK